MRSKISLSDRSVLAPVLTSASQLIGEQVAGMASKAFEHPFDLGRFRS